MELSALTRWESIGQQLYAKGLIGSEIDRLITQSEIKEHAADQPVKSEGDQSHSTSPQQTKHQRPHLQHTHLSSSQNHLTLPPTASLPTASRNASFADGLTQFRHNDSSGRLVSDSYIALHELDTPHQYKQVTPIGSRALTRHTSSSLLRDDANAALLQLSSHPLPNSAAILAFANRATRRFMKGFAVGACGKLAFVSVSLLLRARRQPADAAQQFIRACTSRETLGYGAFLGCFLSSFESFMRLTRSRQRPPPLNRQMRTLLATCIASLSLLCLPRASRSTVALFFLVRAFEVLGRRLADSRRCSQYVPSLVQQHADTLLMSTASGLIIFLWLFHTQSIDAHYSHFINQQSGKSAIVRKAYGKVVALGNHALASDTQLWTALHSHRAALNQPPLDVMSRNLACEVLHPDTQYCSVHALAHLAKGIRLAIPVYAPVVAVPLVLFRAKTLIRFPIQTLYSSCVSVARSSLFLSSFCTVCYFTCCGMLQSGSQSSLNGLVAGALGGACVLIEKQARRIELALYVLAQALPATWRHLNSAHGLPFIRHGDLALFTAAMCVIMNAYVLRPHLLRRSYISLLRFFFTSNTAFIHTKRQLLSHTLSSKNLAHHNHGHHEQSTQNSPRQVTHEHEHSHSHHHKHHHQEPEADDDSNSPPTHRVAHTNGEEHSHSHSHSHAHSEQHHDSHSHPGSNVRAMQPPHSNGNTCSRSGSSRRLRLLSSVDELQPNQRQQQQQQQPSSSHGSNELSPREDS